MKIEEKVQELKAYQKNLKALRHVSNLLIYDAFTTMPAGAAESMGDTMGVISGEIHSMETDPGLKDLLKELYEQKDRLSFQTRREVEELLLKQEKMERLPKEAVIAMEEAENLASHYWEEAKEKNDFAVFAPYLEKLIEMKKSYAACINPDGDVYDTLLDEHERGMTKAKLEPFFDALRGDLMPLMKAAGKKKQPNTSFLEGHFDIAAQKKLSEFVMEVMGIDKNCCILAESEHPFTIGFSKNDIRITTKYLEEDLTSNLYSVVHEGGHAMYGLSIGDELRYSVLGCSASTSLDESQARLWENCIGHSLPFCKGIFPRIKELFPAQMGGVTAEDFYRAINMMKSSVTRLEADELAYPLHIMIRYEIEKKIFAGELSVNELPEAWNRLYKEYLDIDVSDDAQGVLQDAHWASGAFGYFPSYALGSAYAAQIYQVLKRSVDLEACGAKGDFSPAYRWLSEKIYRHGMLYPTDQVIQMACGQAFDPVYYTDYLKDKFSRIYDL